ncbi:MAG: hypothetical protein ABSH22_03695 [Tepidisphaeraceae bacterium]|jgi:hypothetical protein
MKLRSWHSAAVLLVAMAAMGADAPPVTIHIGGSDLKGADLSISDIQTQLAAEIKPVQYNSHGAMHTFACVPLVSLLKLAGAHTDFVMGGSSDPKVKNPQMRQAVIVSGSDGYTVVFSMAEILPMVGDRTVWVALDEDGKPLAASDGPARLIVPGDKMPPRAVHQVADIEVVQLGPPATQPANP